MYINMIEVIKLHVKPFYMHKDKETLMIDICQVIQICNLNGN